MFSGSNLVFNGGTYHQVNKNYGPKDAGFILLSEETTKTAMHDSSARYPPPRCHEETRRQVINFFIDWIKQPNPITRVYWLHAPFGHGKSAVMQSIVEQLEEEGLSHLFAGGFFFGRGKQDRDKITNLFVTIAYQMSVNIPGIHQILNDAIIAKPSLLSTSIETQAQALIIDPLLKCVGGAHFQHPPTVLIDALDECDSIESQLIVINLIKTILIKHNAPLRFLISSRPETHINNALLSAHPLRTIAKEYPLPDDEAEMITYLTRQFDAIYDSRPHLMDVDGIPKPWPGQDYIRTLVQRSQGQYVFLDTILRFVSAHRTNPISQFDIVMRQSSDSSVFADLDSTYKAILEQVPQTHRPILTVILISLFLSYNTPIVSIAELWGFLVSDVLFVVDLLVAVVDRKELTAYYLSFEEYLKDRNRSGEFYVEDDSRKWEKNTLRAVRRSLAGE